MKYSFYKHLIRTLSSINLQSLFDFAFAFIAKAAINQEKLMISIALIANIRMITWIKNTIFWILLTYKTQTIFRF